MYQRKPCFWNLSKIRTAMRAGGFIILLAFSSARFLLAKEILVCDDSFWSQAQDSCPFEKGFQFQDKSRLEDKFSRIGYAFFRFFSIATGSIPLTYLVGSQIYDWSVYVAKGSDPHWQPSWWGWADKRLTISEKTTRIGAVLGVTLGSSLFIAFMDCLLYHLLSSSKN